MLLLTATIFLPVLGVLLILPMNPANKAALRGTAIAVMVADWLLSIYMLTIFDTGTSDYQFVENVPWIGSLGISYHLGVDGLSMLLVFLTTMLSWISVLSTW